MPGLSSTPASATTDPDEALGARDFHARHGTTTTFASLVTASVDDLCAQLDVLAAQAPLLRLDQQLAALVAGRRMAAIDLDQALGGGLAVDAPNATASH